MNHNDTVKIASKNVMKNILSANVQKCCGNALVIKTNHNCSIVIGTALIIHNPQFN